MQLASETGETQRKAPAKAIHRSPIYDPHIVSLCMTLILYKTVAPKELWESEYLIIG